MPHRTPAHPTPAVDEPGLPGQPGQPGQRAPRQERGRRRVDEILEAAEALIVEVGPAATSIQEIARRAGASVGSIYHFFPTKDAIFDALRAQYDVEVQAMCAAILTSALASAELPLRAFVEHMIAPFAELVERRPAMFALDGAAHAGSGQRRPKNAAVEAAMHEALVTALGARAPRASPAELERRARVLGVIGEGIAGLLMHAAPAEHRALFGELTRAMYGYLATFEDEAATPADTSGRKR